MVERTRTCGLVFSEDQQFDGSLVRLMKFGLYLAHMSGSSMFDFWVMNPSSGGSKFDQCKFGIFGLVPALHIST